MSLPTLDLLQTKIEPNLDVAKVAETWFTTFASAAESGDVGGIIALFLGSEGTPGIEGFWRDLLALTWDFRTFQGIPLIKPFLNDRLASSHPNSFTLTPGTAELQQPFPDVAWIQAFFTFQCDAGDASGIFRIVPTAAGWKAHMVLTTLETVKGFPEKIGHLRDHAPNHGKWAERRRNESAFEGEDPQVLIIGGAQSGLGVAARLKTLGVSTLVVEKTARIGDEWRNRYGALCLHDPVWYDHMPYLPFPPTWPVYTPALKLADWLESYAHTMEVNVWTSTTVAKAAQDDEKKWHVTVKRDDGSERVFKVNHLVFATGIMSSPKMPEIPGLGEFKGKVVHSTQHRSAADHAGKKVVVLGSCTSAHDICADHVDHGVDVTMVQRGPTYIISGNPGMTMLLGAFYSEGGPPVDVADSIVASYPSIAAQEMNVRGIRAIHDADKELLNTLEKVGFKINPFGYNGTGLFGLAWGRGGGYYIDVGHSQLLIDGKIKLKSELIERITPTGIIFADGTEMPADVIVCATGYGDNKKTLSGICGEDVGESLKSTWGTDAEGERLGVWRDMGRAGLWYCSGNLAVCRYYSKMLALQIKAIEEGVFGERYSLA